MVDAVSGAAAMAGWHLKMAFVDVKTFDAQ
jgi:hypothetical protein